MSSQVTSSDTKQSGTVPADNDNEQQANQQQQQQEQAPAKSSDPVLFHSFIVNAVRFIVDAKYQPLRAVGAGAYGVVCAALDKGTNEQVAIKKISKAFDDQEDAKRIIREVKLLAHFKHENIIALSDIIPPVQGMEFDDIYMVQELMETDLYKIIYSTNELTDQHIQYFIYQLLCGLHHLHSANVVHRDLKPSNLLLNSNCELKIGDFGLARSVVNDGELTEYVVTRWYRAPEIMVSYQEYGKKVDVWAVGCIMGELFGRKPLFPGDDYIKQMNLIFDLMGTPSEEDMKFITNPAAAEYIRSRPLKQPVPLSRLFPNAPPLGLDLMDKMLQVNPERRYTVAQCLQHPYLTSLRGIRNEEKCETPFEFTFPTHIEQSRETLRDYIWDEIHKFRPHLRPDDDSKST